jgi:F0F1-type ATP synthase membrane subunit c/vacuolar-type H+-ATPase subunit K
MKKNLKRLIFLAIFLTVLIVPYLVFAQTAGNPQANMAQVASKTSFNPATDETTVSSIAGSVVSAALGFLGIIFLILTLYAGFLWMTAQGDSDKVDKSKKLLQNAVIGLTLIISAYGIYQIAARIINATSTNNTTTSSQNSPKEWVV